MTVVNGVFTLAPDTVEVYVRGGGAVTVWRGVDDYCIPVVSQCRQVVLQRTNDLGVALGIHQRAGSNEYINAWNGG